MITVTNNSVQQINAAILALIRQIEKLEKASQKNAKDISNIDVGVVSVNGKTGDVELNVLPEAPTTDGTYSLQCTVSNGEANYSWVAV